MRSNVRKLAECSMLIALATVLSCLKLVDLPYGGSVTMASMLPIVIIAYRHGTGWGLLSGMLFGAIQQLLGLKTLSYVTTWYSILAVVLLDYVLAYAVMGLSGVFRRSVKNQGAAMVYGAALGCVLRYLLHVISGATVWAGLSIPTEAALAYSFSYNATYMLPEALILLVVVSYVGSILDFRAEVPVRMKRASFDGVSAMMRMIGGLCAVCGVVVATVSVFPALQDPESGEFVISRLSSVNFTVPAVALGAGFALFLLLLCLAHGRKKKA